MSTAAYQEETWEINHHLFCTTIVFLVILTSAYRNDCERFSKKIIVIVEIKLFEQGTKKRFYKTKTKFCSGAECYSIEYELWNVLHSQLLSDAFGWTTSL